MMFNLHDFGYFESVLYNVQLVNTQPGIIDLRCHFSWTYQLWIYQLWITSSGHYYWNLIFYGIVIECSVSLLKLRKQFRLKKKILNLMPAEKNETLEEHIIKKKVRECKFNTYIKIICPT